MAEGRRPRSGTRRRERSPRGESPRGRARLATGGRRRPSGIVETWQVAASLVSASTLDEQLDRLLEAAPRVGGADTATIFLRDDIGATPRAIARYGYDLSVSNPPRRGGTTDRVLATGEVVVDDTTTDPSVNPVVPAAGIRSFVALPLLMRGSEEQAHDVASPEVPASAGAGPAQEPATGQTAPGTAAGRSGQVPAAVPRPMGVLYVNARRPGAFDARTVAVLRGLAALAAVAIENNQLLAAQRATASQLREALRVREQFVSASSHELKTPLTPLKGYAQAIQRRLDRVEARGETLDRNWLRRALDVIVDQTERLDGLVTDLLDVSRLRAGQFTLAPESLDLVSAARATFDRFRELQAADAGRLALGAAHVLTFSSAIETLPGVWDRNRLDQLLTNLLNNAVKYSPEGGRVEVRLEPVAATSAAEQATFRQRAPGVDGGWAHLSVRDEGIGLPDDEAARAALFEPFSRGENAEEDRFSGLGLGLYICAEIARHHGGAIWAESAGPNRGTTFHALLPPQPAEAT